MAEEILNVGIAPNDGTGDKIRPAFIKVKNNFAELYEKNRQIDINITGLGPLSAYEIAINNGFSGSESDWLLSLKGIDGTDGVSGITYKGDWISGHDYSEKDLISFGGSGYVAKADISNSIINPYTDTTNWSVLVLRGAAGIDGINGLSAYQIAVNNGFVGTISQWLSSLIGAVGPAGTNGIDGIDGINGTNGEDAVIPIEIASLPTTVDGMVSELGNHIELVDAIAALPFVIIKGQNTSLINSLSEITEGTLFYDKDLHVFRYWNGSAIKTILTD